MTLSDYTNLVLSQNFRLDVSEIETGVEHYLATLRDERAVRSAMELVGNASNDYWLLDQLEKHTFSRGILEEFPHLVPVADEIVRLSYARYANGSYRPELSNKVLEKEKPHEETHFIYTGSNHIWSVCLSSIYLSGKTTGEISDLFEFEDPPFLDTVAMHQEVGRWASHPLFDVWKATPVLNKRAKEIQIRAMGTALQSVLQEGARYGIPSLAIFSDKISRFVVEHNLASIVPIPVRRKDSEHRRFLEEHFSSYWRDANPQVYQISLANAV